MLFYHSLVVFAPNFVLGVNNIFVLQESDHIPKSSKVYFPYLEVEMKVLVQLPVK